jgi:hypothetical protein
LKILNHTFLERIERVVSKEKEKTIDFAKPEAEEPPALPLTPRKQISEAQYPSAQHQPLPQDSSTPFPAFASLNSLSDRRFPGHFENM